MSERKLLLEVENLSLSFYTENGEIDALKNINWKVAEGETLGIVGESGSGKSVTSLAIMKLLAKGAYHIKSGTIKWHQNGKIYSLLADDFRPAISMIFQEPMTSLNPVYTCGDQVRESVLLHQKLNKKEAKEAVLHLFEEVQLPRVGEIFESYPHQISGGQKQRVMIAMALACKPKLIIADEPTTALDVTVQKTILDLLKTLQEKRGMSIIFISHDLGVIKDVAQNVVVMKKGEVVEAGAVAELYHHPKHNYTKGLLACRPTLGRRPDVLPTVADFEAQGNFTPTYTNETTRKQSIEARMTKEPLLSVQNLSVHFGGGKKWGKPQPTVRAVDDVSFDVFKGETLGLVGESGCGKTTLSRALLRLVAPTAGKILVNGNNLLDLSPKALRAARRDLQLIFQDPYSSLNPRKTIAEALMEPMKIHGIGNTAQGRRQQAEALMEKVNMPKSSLQKYPHEFSGGQRQRIVVARTLALKPKFVICDESVSALDVSVQAQVLNLLNDLKAEFGLTYIFISHDMSVVKHMSDRILVMKQGKIEEIAEADTLFTYPQKDYTKHLINSIPAE